MRRRSLRRLIQLDGAARLPWLARLAHRGWLTGTRRLRLYGPLRQPREDRHDDEPAVGELIVTYDSITIVELLARTAKTPEDIARCNRTVQGLASRVEQSSALCEDSHARVDYLHDVIRPHREAVVGGIAQRRISLRSYEIGAESREVGVNHRSGSRALTVLLHLRCARRHDDLDGRHRIGSFAFTVGIGRDCVCGYSIRIGGALIRGSSRNWREHSGHVVGDRAMHGRMTHRTLRTSVAQDVPMRKRCRSQRYGDPRYGDRRNDSFDLLGGVLHSVVVEED